MEFNNWRREATSFVLAIRDEYLNKLLEREALGSTFAHQKRKKERKKKKNVWYSPRWILRSVNYSQYCFQLPLIVSSNNSLGIFFFFWQTIRIVRWREISEEFFNKRKIKSRLTSLGQKYSRQSHDRRIPRIPLPSIRRIFYFEHPHSCIVPFDEFHQERNIVVEETARILTPLPRALHARFQSCWQFEQLAASRGNARNVERSSLWNATAAWKRRKKKKKKKEKKERRENRSKENATKVRTGQQEGRDLGVDGFLFGSFVRAWTALSSRVCWIIAF